MCRYVWVCIYLNDSMCSCKGLCMPVHVYVTVYMCDTMCKYIGLAMIVYVCDYMYVTMCEIVLSSSIWEFYLQ